MTWHGTKRIIRSFSIIDDMLHAAGSLLMGTVKASELMKFCIVRGVRLRWDVQSVNWDALRRRYFSFPGSMTPPIAAVYLLS